MVPLAQRIARWTSNPKVLGSIPRWDGYLKLWQWDFHRKDFVNHFRQASFLGVGVITCALHAQGRRFDSGRKQSVSVCRILLYEEISLYSFVVGWPQIETNLFLLALCTPALWDMVFRLFVLVVLWCQRVFYLSTCWHSWLLYLCWYRALWFSNI